MNKKIIDQPVLINFPSLIECEWKCTKKVSKTISDLEYKPYNHAKSTMRVAPSLSWADPIPGLEK
jgi:hypothetical protein